MFLKLAYLDICFKNIKFPRGNYQPLVPRQKHSIVYRARKKTLSGRPGQVDFPFGQVTFSPSLPHGQGPRQAVHRLNF